MTVSLQNKGGIMKKVLVFLAAVALCGVSFAANAATLIGHWGFEEGSGTTAFDSSSNALNGAISNATYVPGRVGSYALSFNGYSSFVEVGYSPLLNPGTVSISLWFRPDSSQDQWADILDKGHGAGTTPYYGGYVFQYHGDGGLDTRGSIDTAYGNGSYFPALNTGGDYRDNAWHHIVAVLGDTTMALYVDNILVASDPVNHGPIVANASSLYFGRHRTLGRFFSGDIDDVQIYNGALTADQVSNLYNSGTVVPLPGGIFLLGPGLAGLASVRRRFLK